MKISGLFDLEMRLDKIEHKGDPLQDLSAVVDWEAFRPGLESAREKERKSNAGRKPFDVVMMFKILILQSLYNLSDEEAERQVLDRLSFMRFLGLGLGEDVPDATTVWRFRESLSSQGLTKKLFDQFEEYLKSRGYEARKGQIIDASLVSAPRQRNTKEENERIKKGEAPGEWKPAKRRQKDTEARWTKKNGRSYFGYKNHVSVDVKHKLIRDYQVTDAAVHDSRVLEELLDEDDTSRDVWADSAYRSVEKLEGLKERGFREHIQRKGYRNRPLSGWEKQGNRTRARIRARVEHVFGVQFQMAKDLVVRTIGLVRARTKIGLRNLAYNIRRFVTLEVQTA